MVQVITRRCLLSFSVATLLLLRRLCKKCDLYHASLKFTNLKDRLRACGVDDSIPPFRPVRIADRRQRELMAIIAFNELEDAKWLDEDLDDLSG